MKLKLFAVSLFLTVCFLLIHLSVFSQTVTFKTFTRVNENIPGYYEYLPEHYAIDENRYFPIIIFINGTGATGDGSLDKLIKVATNQWGSPPNRTYRTPPEYFKFPKSFSHNGVDEEFIIVSPQFGSEPWGTAVRDIGAFLEYCATMYRVDRSRIYLTGQSSGSSHILGFLGSSFENARKVAAAIISSPSSSLSQNEADIVSRAKVGMWFAASEADPQYGTGGAVRLINDSYNRLLNTNPDLPPGRTILTDPTNTHGSASAYIYSQVNTLDDRNCYIWMLDHTSASALPITDFKLNARSGNNSIDLQWSTTCETSSSTYIVETGNDGKDFKEIYSTPSKNSIYGSEYSFSLNNPTAGVHYFRIKHLDIDGTPDYSNIVSVKFGSLSAGLKIYPNPVNDILSIEIPKTQKKVTAIRIFDNTGKMVKEFTGNNSNLQTFDISILSKGFYAGKILMENTSMNFTFIKK